MIHVCIDSSCPSGTIESLKELDGYQGDVDSHATYEVRVSEAARLWKSRSGSKCITILRGVLAGMYPGGKRCMFCEDSRPSDVEHFRPKALYPEWVFAWTNFLFACGICNGAGWKGAKFSVYLADGTTIDVTRGKKDSVCPPPQGEPLLINPRDEDPLDFIGLDLNTGRFYEREKNTTSMKYMRATFTIGLLGLNERDDLVGARTSVFEANLSMLRDIVCMRSAWEPEDAVQRKRNAILKLGHRVVWEEMKRSRMQRADLREIFTQIPEALAW
jgi:hypothetical protein